jgi:AcrR family transcriptional regulator
VSPSLTELPIAAEQALPVLGGELGERADAARNRARILAAAARLFEERGVENVSMDAIAEAACVGKGTLFRRFGDRSGLAYALLNEREREFQEELIRGDPPLGPGAPPVERIVAFGLRLIEHLEANGEVLLAAETGSRWVRFNAPVYAFYRTHLATLIREAAPDADADYLADALLAPLGADLHLYLRHGRGLDLERVAAGWERLARACVE